MGIGLLFLTLPSAALAKIKVVTTFTVIQDIARNIAGDKAEVVSLTSPGAEIHDYQPTPKDLVRAESAQLVLWNGLNLERWFKRFYGDLETVPSAVVSDGIEPVIIAEGPYKGQPNPHAWMSPANAQIYIKNIRNALIKADPDNADTYKKNAAAYSKKIRELDQPFRETFAKLPEERKWLVSSEGAFSYLARDYGLKELYLWPVNAEIEGTPQPVRKVIDAVRENHIPVVFSESTVSDKPARQIARETGARYGGALYVDSLSAHDGPTPTYYDLLQKTVSTVAEGLKQ